MFVKLIVYTTLLMQLFASYTIAGSLGNIAPNSQVGRIKAATSGMSSCSWKATFCKAGAKGAATIGLKGISQKYEAKSQNYIKDIQNHANHLRAAVKMTDTAHNVGGAKSTNNLTK